MREELLGIPQKRVLRLHVPKLLLHGERQDLRVREPLQRLVASGAGVEEAVGLVGEAEEHHHALFRVGEAWGRWMRTICRSLWWGVGWPLLYS